MAWGVCDGWTALVGGVARLLLCRRQHAWVGMEGLWRSNLGSDLNYSYGLVYFVNFCRHVSSTPNHPQAATRPL